MLFGSPRPRLYLGAILVCAAILAIIAVRTDADSKQIASAETLPRPSASHEPAETSQKETAERKAVSASAHSAPSNPKGMKSSAQPSNETTSAKANSATANTCSLNIPTLKGEFDAEMQKAKKDLDNKLSFFPGQSIASQYVDDYNHQLSLIYNQYESKADAAGCTYEFPKPTELPADYIGVGGL